MTSALPSLVVAANLDALDLVDDYVHQAANQVGLDKKTSARLHLAVDEIVTNIITHGYADNGLEGDLRLSAELTDQALKVIVEDDAPAFDPTHQTRPNLSVPVEERAIGGLGIFLALRYVDKFYYERKAGSNRSVFVVSILG